MTRVDETIDMFFKSVVNGEINYKIFYKVLKTLVKKNTLRQ